VYCWILDGYFRSILNAMERMELNIRRV